MDAGFSETTAYFRSRRCTRVALIRVDMKGYPSAKLVTVLGGRRFMWGGVNAGNQDRYVRNIRLVVTVRVGGFTSLTQRMLATGVRVGNVSVLCQIGAVLFECFKPLKEQSVYG